jgi:XTP/dITP diphosphohydrolase
MKAVLASNNQGKLRELNAILSALGMEVISQSQAGLHLDVEETGTTFEANSYLKAFAACEASGMIAIADDSGLEVDALNGEPGVYSARYGTPDLDDSGRTALLLKNMEGKEPRTCRFVSVITCCFPDGRKLVARGTCEGEVAHVPAGDNGFGYDPIFYVPELGRTFAQLTDEEKNARSHRGKAVAQLAKLLAELPGTQTGANQ